MPVSTHKLGTTEGFSDSGVYGFTDPYPAVDLETQAYRNLVETRMVALADVPRIQDIGVPSWNDVVYGVRVVYARRAMNEPANNLLAAFSPALSWQYEHRNTGDDERDSVEVKKNVSDGVIVGGLIDGNGSLSVGSIQAKRNKDSVQGGNVGTFAIDENEPRISAVFVRVSPRGSAVYFNGIRVGTGPGANMNPSGFKISKPKLEVEIWSTSAPYYTK